MKYLIFSDIDGTFMSHKNYSFEILREYLLKIKKHCIVIFVSSKTFAEMNYINNQLKIKCPFIAENGSCIYFPKNFLVEKNINNDFFEINNHLGILVFKKYEETKKKLKKLQKSFNFYFFSDLTNDFLLKITNLKEEDLLRSRQRFHSDPIYWNDSKEKFDYFFKETLSLGLEISMGGRFIHVSCDFNKGKALSKFLQIVPINYDQKTISLGDSNNDISMLELTDYSCIIRSPVKKRILLKKKNNIYYSKKFAPDGWKESLEYIFKKEKIYF